MEEQFINEKIEVLVAFMKKKVLPLSFIWQKKKYTVSKVNLAYSADKGQSKIYYFEIDSQGDYYKLAFYTTNNNWLLEKVIYAN